MCRRGLCDGRCRRQAAYLGGGGMTETVSWFMAAGEFFSKLANTFVHLVSCIRIRDECAAELAAYQSRINCLTTMENRDSMGLLAAVFTGREGKAKELMTLPWININAQYANGNTPLILAVQGGHVALVRILLDHPSLNVNMRGMDGYTALIRACQDRPDMVSMLLSRSDTDINLATYYGTTALTYAIRCGNEDAVHFLLTRHDLDVNFQSRHCENALIEAVTYRRYDIARALLARRDLEVDVLDFRDRTPLVMAVQYGYAHLVRLILFAGADPATEDDHGRNALFYALKKGSPDMVHDIVEAMSAEPQSLMRLCRLVIRRTIRDKVGNGHRLKPQIDRFKRYEVPRAIKRFLAYDP